MMKHFYKILAFVGFVVWLIGTIHGGFQMTPQSSFERMTDFIGLIFMGWGIFGDIFNGLVIHKTINTNSLYSDQVTVNASSVTLPTKKDPVDDEDENRI